MPLLSFHRFIFYYPFLKSCWQLCACSNTNSASTTYSVLHIAMFTPYFNKITVVYLLSLEFRVQYKMSGASSSGKSRRGTVKKRSSAAVQQNLLQQARVTTPLSADEKGARRKLLDECLEVLGAMQAMLQLAWFVRANYVMVKLAAVLYRIILDNNWYISRIYEVDSRHFIQALYDDKGILGTD